MFDKTARVLMVDDSAADRLLTRSCLEESKVLLDLQEAEDGEEALEYLQGCSDEELPDLILLDLNMPRMSGAEVLAALQDDERLKPIPVVVLTSSRASLDIERSYQLGANCLVSKPVDLEQFQRIVLALSEFWFVVVRLPREAGKKG